MLISQKNERFRELGTAAISELTQTIDLESKQKSDEAVYCNLLATTQAEIIDNLFEDLEEITPDNGDTFTNWLGSLQTSGSGVTSALSTENSARSGRNSTNTTTLNNLKATLKTERETAEKAADRLYRNTEQSAWNGYLTSVQSANTVYIGSIKTAENTYKTASDAADTAYRAASVTAYVDYQNTARDLSVLYSTAVAHAGDTSFNLASYFTTTGGNTACQAYEFITLQEGNLHLATPYDPAQIQTPVFSDSINDSTTQSFSDGFQQYWDSLPRNDVFDPIHLDLERMSPVSHTAFQEEVDQIPASCTNEPDITDEFLLALKLIRYRMKFVSDARKGWIDSLGFMLDNGDSMDFQVHIGYGKCVNVVLGDYRIHGYQPNNILYGFVGG